MSITQETAAQHANDPAITCCRFEAGSVVEPSILEDPAIFPDLIDSGLLEVGDDTMTIGEAIGAKLKETVDALTPLTRDMLEDIPEKSELAEEEEEAEEEVVDVQPVAEGVAQVVSGGYMTIKISEGKDIELSFPIG